MFARHLCIVHRERYLVGAVSQVDCKVANPPFVKGSKLKTTGNTGFNPPDSERGFDSMYPDPDPTPALITVKFFESKSSIIVTMIFIIVVTVITPTFRRRFCIPDGNYCQTLP